jgi:hypothetical protein
MVHQPCNDEHALPRFGILIGGQMNTRPAILILLIILLILLGLGGVGGGIAMFVDPSGQLMGLPADLLDGLPIASFILPGVFLVIGMGLAPFVVAWGLWQRLPWAWIATVAQSIVLILWICFQIFLWGSPIALQVVYLVWGFVMLGMCFLPGVRNLFRSEA